MEIKETEKIKGNILTTREKAYLLVLATTKRDELVETQIQMEKFCPGIDDLNQEQIETLDSIIEKLNKSLN